MASLAETYRPRSWAEVIGQEKVVAKIDRLRSRGLAGRAFWISGASGTGKTTIARLLAGEVADDWATEELDAQMLTPARVAHIERESRSKPLGGRGWCWIVNEAHGLSRQTVLQLLTLLDRLPPHATWVFTTTVEGQARLEGMEDSGPMLSRCIRLELSRQGLAPLFARRAREIAQREGLDGQSEAKYLRLVQECRNNFRAVLQAIEAGEML